MRISLIILLNLLATVALSQNLRSGGALKPEQANMDIRHYTINLDVDPVAKSIKGFTEIQLVLLTPASAMLIDLWHGLQVSEVRVDGSVIPFKHGDDDIIRMESPKSWQAGKHLIKVNYGGMPGVAERAPWTGGFQWSADSKGNPWVAITCQSEGGKIFFPCKDHPSDEPNEGADLWITVPKGLVAVGPGLLIGSKNAGNKTTWHWKTNYTISNYCLVFNIGKYTVVRRPYTSVSGTKIPMEFYILEEDAAKGPHMLEMLERTTRILEKYFGEYPWAKERIGLVETPHLGMEHQSSIAYGNKFRYTQVGGQDFDWLLNHEFGHEWWANKVTNKDWAHMWIQEGICSFGDALYIRDMDGEEAYRKRMRETARNTSNKKPIVQGEVVDSDDTYQGDIYGKGALFMHTLRYVIGDSIFFPALKKLATDPATTYDNMITSDDVERLFSNASGRNLKPLFDLFLRTTDKLEFSIKQKSDNSYLLKVTNLDMALPIEVMVDGRLLPMTVGKEGITIQAKTLPQIDPQGFYLKKVIVE
ncbi:MAG TPA: M1 family metallopeptidase [Cyclobacteriaceae bacterium]|nr:M1 family metallopeptidase [Cyclobacteriaceae bacterium]